MKVRLRFELGIATLMASAMTLLWFVGESGQDQIRMAVGAPFQIGGPAVVMILIAILILHALFTAAETTVNLIRPVHLRQAKDDKRLQDLVQNNQKYATACTLGSRLTRLLIGLMVVLLAASFGLVHWQSGEATFDLTNFLLYLAIIAIPVALVNSIVGELVPKSFAALHPHKTGLRLYPFIRAASFIFSIPANALVALANVVTRTFGGRASFVSASQAEDEILTIVESAQEAGEIEVDEKELLTSVFEFTHTVAREVMTPRVDVDAMPVRSEAEELARVMRESGHSRIPLYEDTDDQIVGIIHAKDLLMAMVGEEKVNVRSLMRPAVFVPEGKVLHELLREMRQSRSQMAVVQDEFGGTAGILTIEDIVEELVGDIVDEYDPDVQPAVAPDVDGFIVDGKTHLDEVNDAIGSQFESDEFDTVGGYVFGLFGRQPKPGDTIDCSDFRFTVVETDGKRILTLRIDPVRELEPNFEEA